MRHFINIFSKLGLKDVIGCEVGVEAGDHALSMFEGVNFKELHLVENNPQFEAISYEKLKSKPVVWHRDDSTAVAKELPDSYFDFIYIDADHSYESVVEDLNAWYPKVKVGGYLAGHDWLMVASVQRAVREFVEKHNIGGLKFLDDDRGTPEDWYFKK